MISKVKTVFHVTLSEAKRQCQLEESFVRDDAYITSLIKAASEIAENEIQKDISKTTNVLTRYDFAGDTIRVNEGNLISITSIAIQESGVPLSNFITYVYRDAFKVELDSDVDTSILTVTFETGFAANTCPYQIKQAILLKIRDLYDVDRSSYVFVSNKNSGVFETLLAPFKASHVENEREN